MHASRPHTHLKIDFTPKLSTTCKIWNFVSIFWGVLVMNIFHNFVSIFFLGGGSGEAYVESRITKVSWRSHHTGDICTVQQGKQWIISFSYIKTLTSLTIWGPNKTKKGKWTSIIRLGPSWFTSTLSLFNNNVHVKYRSNLIRAFRVNIKNMRKNKIIFIFFGVKLGPYIKSRGSRGTEMSANADHITVETYVQQGETIWKLVFHIWTKM